MSTHIEYDEKMSHKKKEFERKVTEMEIEFVENTIPSLKYDLQQLRMNITLNLSSVLSLCVWVSGMYS